jgi:benzoyl-CoA reductase/2-hydroxyglutaryl-CoA dehydratase subunit BcrC/BadD/HgdB
MTLNLEQYAKLIDDEQKAFQADKAVKKVGYICNYIPVELLSAAGVRHARLVKAGSTRTVSAGELFTQSVFCDFTKSCIGFFQDGSSLYKSFDKVYNFHSCSTMKRASEVIEQFVPTKLLNLPKMRPSQDARDFFRLEIINFKNDLEELTGNSIQEEEIQRQITIYNRARRLLKQISDLRKDERPVLTGAQFLDITLGYYYLPGDKLVPALEKVLAHLQAKPRGKVRPLRLMVSGSIIADGDRRLLDIIEEELDARVVIEDHCAGVRPFYHTISETDEPYRALSNGYLDQAPCARMKPLSDGVEFSGRLARDYAVDGVIYSYLKFCACYGVSKKEFTDKFRNQKLPVLELSSDYSESDHGQIKTRIEAFIEVLREKQSNHTTEQLHA